MGDTGAIALGATLGVVAMLTNSVLVLPIIGFVFVGETLSVIIQLTSKKLRNGKKVFLSAPIHHHFEAIGWPEYKVTMRFWLIGMVTAVVGVIIGILGRG
jgi:phospho-N-acetylmuramoyl-pentapeptide-transferase